MSAGDRNDDNTGRKTLSPESLPMPASGVTLTPQQRVAERAHILLQRFRGLGTAAGAAVLSLQCSGYAVVDPLPPPPMQCSVSPDPFAKIHAAGFPATGNPASAVMLVLSTNAYPPDNYVGFRVGAVRVTGGTLVSVDNQSSTGEGGSTRFQVIVAPTSTTAEVLVEVDLGCGAATATKRYSITEVNGLIIVVEVPPAGDAGTD